MKKDLKLSLIKVVGLTIGFGMQLIFTKVIGVKEYGVYVLFTTWTSLLSIILILGYDRLIIKHLSFYYIQRKKEKFRSLLDKLILLILTNSLIFLILAFALPQSFLTTLFFSTDLIRSTWLLIAIGAVTFTLFDLFGKILSSMQRVELNYIRSEILYKFILLITVIILFFNFYKLVGVNVIIVGVITSQLITLLIFILFSERKKISQYLKIEKEKESISKENYVFFFSSLNYYFLTQIDKLFLGKYESLETLGVYGLVSTLVSIISFSTIVYQRFYPKISNYVNTNNINGLEIEFKTVTRNSLIIALPIMMFVIVFTNDILSFFGERFTAGTDILRVLIWGQLTNFLTGPNGNVLNIGNRSKVDFINSIIVVALTTVLIFVGYKYYGVIGVATATSFGLVLINLVKVVEVKLFYKIFPYEIKNICLTIAVFLAFFFVKSLHINISNIIINLIINFTLSLIASFLFIGLLYTFFEKRYDYRVMFSRLLNRYGG